MKLTPQELKGLKNGRFVTKTDSNCNLIVVDNHDLYNEEGGAKKHRHTHTNIIPKKKKRKSKHKK